MKSRWWDPGIGYRDRVQMDYYGEPNREGNHEGFSKDQSGIAKRQGKEIVIVVLSEDWLPISDFNTTQSIGYQGDNPAIPLFSNRGKGILRFGKMETCALWVESGRRYEEINVITKGIVRDSFWCTGTVIWFYYKSYSLLGVFFITFNVLSLSKLSCNKGFTVTWFLMAQGQLVGSMGTTRGGEGTRKRLKITVAHFDNSDLIRSCSKILVGRCMNPPDQEMKALLTNLPKIWKLEDRITGKDLGLGKLQFEFEKEEDIEGVLKHQPYHFDFWMIAVAKWQPKRSINYPHEIPFWVRVLGVSKEFRTVPTFESIGDAIGRVVEVDLELMRVLVVVDAFKELCFETSVDFT